MNMGVLGKERTYEVTGFYRLEAGVFDIRRHVRIGVSPRNRTRGQLYSEPEGA